MLQSLNLFASPGEKGKQIQHQFNASNGRGHDHRSLTFFLEDAVVSKLYGVEANHIPPVSKDRN
jgi:hypothetical protein